MTKKIFNSLRNFRKRKWRQAYSDMLTLGSVEERFEAIYRKNLWRSSESVSGPGSTIKFTKNLQAALPELFEKFNVTSVFDAPCGDLNWMQHVLKKTDIGYIGGDIVGSLIEAHKNTFTRENTGFIQINLISDPFPTTDLMLCRDCLFHMSHADTLSILKSFLASETSYLLTTTYNRPANFENEDIVTGGFRVVDLSRYPYDFPSEPLYSILDGKKQNTDRFLNLWSRDQLITAVESMSKHLGVRLL